MQKLLIGTGILLSFVFAVLYICLGLFRFAMGDFSIWLGILALLTGLSFFVVSQFSKWMHEKETMNKTLLIFLFVLNLPMLIFSVFDLLSGFVVL